MVSIDAVHRFLAGKRIAVVGVSADPKNFGAAVHRALLARGYESLPVNPAMRIVDGVQCHPDLASIEGVIDGVIVMVSRERSAGVVRDCVTRQVKRVWLFKGIGAPGAVSEEALELCRAAGIEVVDGACPLMFLEPVGFVHRLHRRLRRLEKPHRAAARVTVA